MIAVTDETSISTTNHSPTVASTLVTITENKENAEATAKTEQGTRNSTLT